VRSQWWARCWIAAFGDHQSDRVTRHLTGPNIHASTSSHRGSDTASWPPVTTNGMCGKQALVIAARPTSLLAHKDQRWPGRRLILIDDSNSIQTPRSKIGLPPCWLSLQPPHQAYRAKGDAHHRGSPGSRTITQHLAACELQVSTGRAGSRREWLGIRQRLSPRQGEGGYVQEGPRPVRRMMPRDLRSSLLTEALHVRREPARSSTAPGRERLARSLLTV
jgi:hypothetical protein